MCVVVPSKKWKNKSPQNWDQNKKKSGSTQIVTLQIPTIKTGVEILRGEQGKVPVDENAKLTHASLGELLEFMGL